MAIDWLCENGCWVEVCCVVRVLALATGDGEACS